jgi:diphthine-ammonia ligase
MMSPISYLKEPMEKAFASWSGGKDCCLAAFRAKRGGMDIRYLANTVTEDGQRSCSHGISAAVIKKQAEAIGIPIVQQKTTGSTYEAKFTKMLQAFHAEGVTGGVFGDIDFGPHREWIEKVCGGAGTTAHLPLWQEDQRKLAEEFIDAGFEAIVVAAKKDLFDESILGRRFDREFLDYIQGLGKSITPCGEAGEFHTLVVDGPLFRNRLVITESKKVARGDHYFLEISGIELKDKIPVPRR